MPCYSPLEAWRPVKSTRSKNPFIFSYHPEKCSSVSPDLTLPCGQCIGCRLERSRQWAVRCVHEASLHKRNCFITLTYNNDHLPEDRGLHYDHFQLFMKRLRKKYGEGIRFYMCGEYGEKLGRPHFHACLFNHDFSDKTPWKTTETGFKLFRSKELEELWPYGYSSVGAVSFESAAYVARYIMKKVNGEAAEMHYTFCRSIHRGDIRAPARIYSHVAQARYCERLVPKISL